MEDNEKIWRAILKSKFSINQLENLCKKHGFLALVVHDKRGFSVLHWAVILGLEELLVFLLNKGVPVDLKVKIKEEPIAIHLAALEGRLKIIDILIKYGTNINAVDKKGCTPLMRAAMYGFNAETKTAETILFLLSRGANPKMKDNIGFTALHHAVFFGREETVSLLLTIGLDPNQRDKDGFKPLDIALHIKNRYIIEELAQYTFEAQSGMMDDIIRRCSKRKWIDFLDSFFIFFARLFVLFFVITTLFWSYPQYIFHYYPASKDLLFIHIALLISSSCLWICWYRVMQKDPGYLPIDSEEYYEVLEYKLNLVDQNRMHQIIPDDIFSDAGLCHICRTLQPAKSKHCRFCKRCVEGFDHHCMYLSNCIGKRNRLSFHCLIFHMQFVGALYLVLILIVMNRRSWRLTYENLVNLVFCIKLLFIGGVLGFCSFKRQIKKSKVADRKGSDNYDYLSYQDGGFYNQSRKGIWANLKDYFKANAFFINSNNHSFADRGHYQRLHNQF